MYASTAIALFAVAAVARPQQASSLLPREIMETMTLGQAQKMCGADQAVTCCTQDVDGSNMNPEKADGFLANLFGNVLGGDASSLLGQCSAIDVPVIGVTDILKKKCSGDVACCDKSPSVASGGLINLSLPCFALGSVA